VDLVPATFVGLTLGLDLPVMATPITAAGWRVIAASARLAACEIELKAEDAAGLDAALQAQAVKWKLRA
jgi:hypothetical protein